MTDKCRLKNFCFAQCFFYIKKIVKSKFSVTSVALYVLLCHIWWIYKVYKNLLYSICMHIHVYTSIKTLLDFQSVYKLKMCFLVYFFAVLYTFFYGPPHMLLFLSFSISGGSQKEIPRVKLDVIKKWRLVTSIMSSRHPSPKKVCIQALLLQHVKMPYIQTYHS